MRVDRRDRAEEDLAGAAVERDDVALVDDVLADVRLAQRHVDDDALGAGDAGLAHAAGDDRRVRGLAAAARQDALRGEEAVDVFGARLFAHQDHVVADLAHLLGQVRIENTLAGRRARRCGQARRDRRAGLVAIEARMQQLLEQLRVDPQQGLLLVDQALFEHLDRRLDGRRGVHLAVAGLQAIQRSLLDRELVVLHFLVVRFERVAQLHELAILLRHFLFHFRQRLRRADARHDVLALRVGQVFAEHLVVAGARVAGEADAGRAVVALVAEDHRADIDRGAVGHVRRDVEFAPVVDGALAHPGAEHGLDGQLELLHDVLREVLAGLAPHHTEELLADLLEVAGIEADVGLDADAYLDLLEEFIEVFVADAQCHLAEQLDEATIGVVGEALVAGLLDEPGQRLVVESQVQDRVHHSGHRQRRAGTHGDQQRILAATKRLAGLLFKLRDFRLDLCHQLLRELVLFEVVEAGLRRDDETRGNVQADLRHFAEVGALAAKEFLVVAVAFGE